MYFTDNHIFIYSCVICAHFFNDILKLCFAPYGVAISSTNANTNKLSDTAAENIIFANNREDAIQEKGYYWH